MPPNPKFKRPNPRWSPDELTYINARCKGVDERLARSTAGLSSRYKETLNVKREIKRRLDAVGIDVERTLEHLAAIAYSDIRDLYNEDGSLKNPHELDDKAAWAVQSIKSDEITEGRGDDRRVVGYTKETKMYNKLDGLGKAMQHLGIAGVDKKDITSGGEPLKALVSVDIDSV